MVLGRSTGGIGTHVVALTEGLRRLGDDVVVVTDALTADRFAISGARRWWPGRSAGLRGSLRHLRDLRRLARGSDVVHAHGHQAGLVAAVATLGLATPLVVSQHNAVLVDGPRRRLLDLAQKVVARRARLETGASSDLVEEARRHGARDARLAPVPSPRVPELLERAPLEEVERRGLAAELLGDNGIDVPSGTPLVLSIARIAPQKRLEALVDAAASLAEHWDDLPTPVWVVVGGGDEPLRRELMERARHSSAPVHFVGQQDDPDRWLRAADVFVLTSAWEARALVVQEALAAGVPVVAPDVGGLRDLVAGVGTLVDAEAPPEELAGAVRHFLADPAARRTASTRGRELATSWDDDDATARRWRQWYVEVARMT